jgi:hypothetical protein
MADGAAKADETDKMEVDETVQKTERGERFGG